jgi:hypothetical protein
MVSINLIMISCLCTDSQLPESSLPWPRNQDSRVLPQMVKIMYRRPSYTSNPTIHVFSSTFNVSDSPIPSLSLIHDYVSSGGELQEYFTFISWIQRTRVDSPRYAECERSGIVHRMPIDTLGITCDIISKCHIIVKLDSYIVSLNEVRHHGSASSDSLICDIAALLI